MLVLLQFTIFSFATEYHLSFLVMTYRRRLPAVGFGTAIGSVITGKEIAVANGRNIDSTTEYLRSNICLNFVKHFIFFL